MARNRLMPFTLFILAFMLATAAPHLGAMHGMAAGFGALVCLGVAIPNLMSRIHSRLSDRAKNTEAIHTPGELKEAMAAARQAIQALEGLHPPERGAFLDKVDRATSPEKIQELIRNATQRASRQHSEAPRQ